MMARILLELWGTYWLLGELHEVLAKASGTGIGFGTDDPRRSITLTVNCAATQPVQVGTILLRLSSVELLRWIVKRCSAPKNLTAKQIIFHTRIASAVWK